ncbi:MAG: cysteine desulfurase family protein [candidate division KSB1 bacterium]
MIRIYLDYCATTPLAPEVFDAMRPYLTQLFGNASSIHSFGRDAKVAIDHARELVAHALNALPQEITFTSGGTEANNTALFGLVQTCSKPGHLITSRIEHPSVLQAVQELETRGWACTYVDPDQVGMITVEAVAKAMRSDTILLSIMHANNEVGTINPIAEIATLAKERGILFHTDAVQTFGKIPIDLRAVPVSLLSLSGHKIYGPKGVGALFVRRSVKIASLLHGGKQERERRPGTENVAAIVGLGHAVALRKAEQESEIQRLRKLSESFIARVQTLYPNVSFNGNEKQRLPGVVNLSFPGMDSLALVMSLDLQGVAVSNGSACSSGSVEPSHVLRAMKVSRERANSAIRFSLGKCTTEAEIETTVQALEKILAKRMRRTARREEVLSL